MIHYALRCAAGHEFDGWFGGSVAFADQRASGLIECPSCGSVAVDRALMAPNVARGAVVPADARPAAAVEAAPAAIPARLSAHLPAEMVAQLQRLRAEVEKRCDNVGDALAPMALSMHRGEIEHRAIYGQADEEQAAELRDEGIELMRLPWVRPADG